MQVLSVIGWIFLVASIKSLTSLRCLRLLNNTYILFWSSVDYISTTVILWYYIQRLKYIYLYASAVHLNIVWFDYIVANYVTVIPHRAHRWNVWKSGCDRLVSEPTLSELNTILMCLISMTQLHIHESRQEHRTNPNCYSSLSFIVYCDLKIC